jgi:hypothetical protein
MHIFSHFHSLLHFYTSCRTSPDLQIWCDLLNTPPIPASQSPIFDEFVDASLLHCRSDASSTPRPNALFQLTPPTFSYPPLYEYPSYLYHPPGHRFNEYLSVMSLTSTSGRRFDGRSSAISLPITIWTSVVSIPSTSVSRFNGRSSDIFILCISDISIPSTSNTHSGGGDKSSGGETTFQMTQAPVRTKKRND